MSSPAAVASAPSPCFVLDERRLRANLEVLADASTRSGAKILCALKGFAFQGAAPLVRSYLPGVCASSLAEARLGADVFGGEVHAYAPAYIDGDFDEIARLSSHVTFNSVSELSRYRGRLRDASAGLRINPEYAEVETDMYNPCVPGSRLGVTAAVLGDALPPGVEGLHSHSMCEQGTDTLGRTLEHIETRFGPMLDRVRWLNLGGGHAITRAGYDIDGLVRQIQGLRARHPTLAEVILEPGSAVGWDAGVLVSTVLDVVVNGDVKTAMLDASFAAHMPDCLEMPYRPAVRGARTDGTGPHRYHLGGQTCLAGDFLPDYGFDAPLQPGDRVVFEDMLHYTMVKTTTFNGVRLPAIAAEREDGTVDVLKTFDDDEYRRRI